MLSTSTKHISVLLLLLVVITITKLYLLLFTNTGSNFLVADEYTNLDYANTIIKNFTYISHDGLAYRPPMYSVFLGIVKILFGNKIIYYKIANILLNISTITLIYLSLKPKIRLWGVFFFALCPPIFFLYELVLAENLAVFLIALIVKVYVDYSTRPQTWRIFTIGLLSGLLLLTRPENLFSILIFHFILILRNKKAVLSIFLVGCIVHVWLVRNYIVFNRYPLMSTNAANTLYLATFPESTGTGIYTTDNLNLYPSFKADLLKMQKMSEIEKYDFYIQKAKSYLATHPQVFLSLLPKRIMTLLAPESTVARRLIAADRYRLSAYGFASFLVLAFIWDITLWVLLLYSILKRRIDWAYLAFLLGLILTVCFVIAEARFKMQIMPALIVGIFSTFLERIKQR